jgi:hypothetical protein
MKVLANQITAKELGNLCSKSSKEKIVSLILSSTTIADLNKKLNVKFKNSIKRIEELIKQDGEDAAPYLSLLKGIDLNTELLKLPRTKSLVIYISKKQVQIFNLIRTIKDTPLITFSKSRIIKHLIGEIDSSQEFLILDLSLNDVNLYKANKYQIEEHKAFKLPGSIKDVYEIERQGVFNMKENKKDEQDAMTKSFLLMLDNELVNKLNEEKIPMMLAGSENITALYKSLSKYKYIWESTINGNIDRSGMAQIHSKALVVLKKQVNLNIETNIKKITEQYNLGKGSNSFENIFEAAIAGRVGRMVFKSGFSVWGKYENDKLQISMKKNLYDEDLMNLLICIVLGTGAQVYSSPSRLMDNDVIAEYRY